ncbi:MAG: leucine-rich repeat domain-containing protein [Prevotellaceae bacterium]|nr:leucine-rich repeat domain-containing protein [Prevotellaceae bacterium]
MCDKQSDGANGSLRHNRRLYMDAYRTFGQFTLTISGTGAMGDYNYSSPWYSYSSGIKTLNIQQRVTTIGRVAFSGCSSLTSVTIY